MATNHPPTRRQPGQFLWLYALAWAGGAVAYVPFLTVLLPVRVAALVPGHQVQWLAYMTFCGACAASVGGILFGWLSDLSGTRRPWIAAGLVLTVLLTLAIGLAQTVIALLLLIVLWQLALNMMLGPLAAWASDHVPREQLGLLGGLLAFSPAFGSAAGAFVTIRGFADWNERLMLVALMVSACVLPALLLARPAKGSAPAATALVSPPSGHLDRRLAAVMWLARFLVQISEAALFAYLYYWFQSVDGSLDAAWVARVCGIVLALAVPCSLVVGRWSDLRARPMQPLIWGAGLASLALIVMATSHEPAQAVAGYVVFGMATATFLSLHSAQILRVLKQSNLRGRDLGLFNLTNTGPSLVMPWITIALVPAFGFSTLFLVLAALAACASLILISVARRLRRA